MVKGERLDLLLEKLGYFSSRQVARAAIMDGGVIVNGTKLTKPGTYIKDGAKIEICKSWQLPKYVSRAGLKLEKALHEFGIQVAGRVCLDVGASTGGFTDCLLKSGAERVYAIDVGHSQLHSSLRQNPRVIVLEKCNARFLNPSLLGLEACPLPDLAVMDLSFISLEKVLEQVASCLAEKAEICALIKPQFEAGAQHVEKGGIVKSAAVHKEVIANVISKSAKLGFECSALSHSPIKGAKGNIEFLILLRRSESIKLSKTEELPLRQLLEDSLQSVLIQSVVNNAHEELNKNKSVGIDE